MQFLYYLPHSTVHLYSLEFDIIQYRSIYSTVHVVGIWQAIYTLVHQCSPNVKTICLYSWFRASLPDTGTAVLVKEHFHVTTQLYRYTLQLVGDLVACYQILSLFGTLHVATV